MLTWTCSGQFWDLLLLLSLNPSQIAELVMTFPSLYQNISPNMKLWGVVIEVNQKDIVLSLPGGIRGFVRSEDVCDIALQENRKVDIFFLSNP
jgi:hypothetical protein